MKRFFRTSCTWFAMFTATSDASVAQITGAVPPDSATAPSVEQNLPPPGSCMPIGITVSGDVVFPFQCKEFIEQRKTSNSKPAADQEQKPILSPPEVVPPGHVEPRTKTVETALSPKRPDQEQRIRQKVLPDCTNYRSYDPASKTFFNYDGQRRSCR
jgi:hypothetical protein